MMYNAHDLLNPSVKESNMFVQLCLSKSKDWLQTFGVMTTQTSRPIRGHVRDWAATGF